VCNDYRLTVEGAAILEDFSDLKIKIRFSEGTPNIQARDDIKITDTAPIVRTVDGERKAGDLVQRRWSWPGQNGRPVYNSAPRAASSPPAAASSSPTASKSSRSRGQEEEEAEGQVAVHQEGRAVVLHRLSGGPTRMSAKPSRC
jgi:putative SOS response-associated peptidase YedK